MHGRTRTQLQRHCLPPSLALDNHYHPGPDHGNKVNHYSHHHNGDNPVMAVLGGQRGGGGGSSGGAVAVAAECLAPLRYIVYFLV